MHQHRADRRCREEYCTDQWQQVQQQYCIAKANLFPAVIAGDRPGRQQCRGEINACPVHCSAL